MKFKETISKVEHAPAVPSFSARGPSKIFRNILKPDNGFDSNNEGPRNRIRVFGG